MNTGTTISLGLIFLVAHQQHPPPPVGIVPRHGQIAVLNPIDKHAAGLKLIVFNIEIATFHSTHWRNRPEKPFII